MKHLELYKKLPKTNCGKCRPGACMPFAFAVIAGSSQLQECPGLAPEEAALLNSIEKSDWREELIDRLGQEVRAMDFTKIAAGLGAKLQDRNLLVGCMGREFIITPDGKVSSPHGAMTPWIKILLLHYVRLAGSVEPAGKWVSYADLKAGRVKASSFLRDCEEPLRHLFDEGLTEIEAALGRMGGAKCDGMPTPHAWGIALLPKVPVLILYWPLDEEFPSKVQVLFDATADRFLDAESLIFLVEGFVMNLERLLGKKTF